MTSVGTSPAEYHRIVYKRMKRGLKITWGDPAQSAQVTFAQWGLMREMRSNSNDLPTWWIPYVLQKSFIRRGWMAFDQRKNSWLSLTELGVAIRDSIPPVPAQKDRPAPLKARKAPQRLPEITPRCLKIFRQKHRWKKSSAVPIGGTKPVEALWASEHSAKPQMRALYANGLVEPGILGPEWIEDENRCVQGVGCARLVWRKTPQAILAGY